jgi:glyoxylase I family protein
MRSRVNSGKTAFISRATERVATVMPRIHGNNFLRCRTVRPTAAEPVGAASGAPAAQAKEEQTMTTTKQKSTDADTVGSHLKSRPDLALDFHGVRYQAEDVARSVAFYTDELGFKLEHQHLPEFATVSLGALKIHLSGPEASGSRAMPDGQRQEPGGWNRVVLRVNNLVSCIEVLKNAGLQFRNEMEVGPAGKQIQLEDPDGNPIELFEPARGMH